MNKKQFRQAILGHLQGMVYDKKFDPQYAPELIEFIDDALKEREEFIVTSIGNRIRAWEDTMGDDDKSLYTLGMRHAIDVIKDHQPETASEYQPIEEDYRPKDGPNKS